MRRIHTGRRKHVNLFFLFLILWCESTNGISSIDQLEGKAGFRTASLKWIYPAESRIPVSFRVRYCELHSWGLHRCRDEVVDEPSVRTGRQERNDSNEVFLIEIGGLRMATNYTFQVIPQEAAPPKYTGRPSQISLQTKGFSAKATKCLADSSEVSVETGPFFGGRISVEDSTKPGCFVKGDVNSSQTKYNLRIRHHDCGSTVNGSKVTTVILVQENVPILTHSTRRFVVVCSFSPESFIVQAGVTLPRETSVAKSLDFSRIIRIPPQASNLLNANAPPASARLQENREAVDAEDEKNEMKHSFLMADRESGRANLSGADSLQKGSLETILVLGMICIAVLASLVSLIWFIKSYRRAGRMENESSIDDNESIESPYDSHSSADNRSEFEVELDFEFSEDNNHHETHQTSNNSRNLSNKGNESGRSSASSAQSHIIDDNSSSSPSSFSSTISSSFA